MQMLGLAGCLITFQRTSPKWVPYSKLETCQTSYSVSETVMEIRVQDTETITNKLFYFRNKCTSVYLVVGFHVLFQCVEQF